MAKTPREIETIWITGASSGIGRKTALLLARDGVTVLASARRAEALDALAREAAEMDGRILPYPVDVTDPNAVAETFKRMTADIGIPDAALLNAGTFERISAKKIDPTLYARVMDVNFMGVVNCLSPLIAAMWPVRRGTIAIVASLAGYRGLPGGGAYSASKAALIALAESLDSELAPRGIAVKVINPGFIRTPMTADNRFSMPFLMDADAAARRIVSALYAKRFETTFPRRLSWPLKLIQRLPNAVYLRLMRRMAKSRTSGE